MVNLPYRRIWGESAFLLVCSIASNASLFLGGILVMRRYGDAPSLSDHYFLVLSILVFGTLLANQGVPLAATRLISSAAAGPGSGGPSDMVSSTLALAVLYALAASAAVLAFLALFPVGQWTGGEVLALGACILCYGPAKWIAGVLQGLGRIRLAGLYETLLDGGRLAALAAALRCGNGVEAVLPGWALAGGAHLLLGAALLAAALSARGIRPSLRSGIRREHASLALSLFLPFAGLFAITQFLVVAVASTGQPGDASRLAIAMQVASLLLMASFPLGAVLLPHLSRAAAREGGHEAVMAATRPIFLGAGASLIAAAVLIAALADPLIRLLYTPAAAGAAPVARVLCLVYLVESFKHFLDPALVVRGRWKELAALEALRVVLVLLAGHWAVERWGIPGAAACLGLAVAIAAAGKWTLWRPGASMAAAGGVRADG
jgi:O-antigen/teichoic acid export membrane protein